MTDSLGSTADRGGKHPCITSYVVQFAFGRYRSRLVQVCSAEEVGLFASPRYTDSGPGLQSSSPAGYADMSTEFRVCACAMQGRDTRRRRSCVTRSLSPGWQRGFAAPSYEIVALCCCTQWSCADLKQHEEVPTVRMQRRTFRALVLLVRCEAEAWYVD